MVPHQRVKSLMPFTPGGEEDHRDMKLQNDIITNLKNEKVETEIVT